MSHLLTTLSTSLIECDTVLSHKVRDGDPEVKAVLQRSMEARKAFADAFPEPETTQAPVRVLMSVSNPNDMSQAPDYATVLVNDEFIAQLRNLQGVCKSLNIDMVHVNGGPDAWHHLGHCSGDDHRTELDYLCVSRDMFYFTANPKHHDLPFESEAMVIDDFIKRALASQDDYLILAEGVDEEELDEILGRTAAPSGP
ncbi:hypothetical protein LJR168_003879 [Pseudoxanthomonas sp. LjRoot168]|uniref:hypothetical protein n=1 Tax=unclassified Pseudoxanthomonas TaxID=2645906 RepID=UPI003ECEDCD3